LLHDNFRITIVAPFIGMLKDKPLKRILEPYGIPCVLIRDIPKKSDGVALGVCDAEFFTSGRARELTT
jgi:hypothetical protein